MRSLTLFLALLIGVAVFAPVSAAGEPIEINAILSQTGPLAFLGRSEIQALEIAEGVVNKAGGVKGQPIHFAVADDQGNPQVGLQLANGLIAKKVPVIMGPSFGAVGNAIAPMLANGPVMLCFSPVVRVTPGGYAFSPVVSTAANAGVGVRYFRLRGWKRLALVSSTDATGLDGDAATLSVLALPENRSMELVAHEHFAPGDINVAAQVAHIQAAHPDAIFVWTSGTPFGTFVHGLSDAGIAVPVFTPNSNMTPTAMKQFASFLPRDLYFASVLGQAPMGAIGKGPIRDAQAVYNNAMRAAGVHPDVGHAIIWDSAMMVVDAYRHFGPGMTAAQLHEWIEGLHGWVGINGIYTFTDGAQHGMYGSSNEMLFRWDAARGDFVGASRPGGALLQ